MMICIVLLCKSLSRRTNKKENLSAGSLFIAQKNRRQKPSGFPSLYKVLKEQMLLNYALLTLAACGPRLPSTISKETA